MAYSFRVFTSNVSPTDAFKNALPGFVQEVRFGHARLVFGELECLAGGNNYETGGIPVLANTAVGMTTIFGCTTVYQMWALHPVFGCTSGTDTVNEFLTTKFDVATQKLLLFRSATAAEVELPLGSVINSVLIRFAAIVS